MHPLPFPEALHQTPGTRLSPVGPGLGLNAVWGHLLPAWLSGTLAWLAKAAGGARWRHLQGKEFSKKALTGLLLGRQ